MKLPVRQLVRGVGAVPLFVASLAWPQIAALTCSTAEGEFLLAYAREGDDFFSDPKLLHTCLIGKVRYTVTGSRSPFTETGRCGAQPPVFIEIRRDNELLVSDAVFGDNCHLGPAISRVRAREVDGRLTEFAVCVLPRPSAETVCRSVSVVGAGAGQKAPVTQATLNRLAAQNER